MFNKLYNPNIPKTPENLPFEEEIKKLPALEKGQGLWQNNFHEFDVYNHTLKFVEFIKQFSEANNQPLDPNIVAAAYLHDIGKPVVAKDKIRDGMRLEKEPGKPYHEFDDHEIVGAQMVKDMSPDFFVRYNLNQGKIEKLVGAHFIPMKNIKQMRKAATYEDFVNKYYELEKSLDETGLARNEVMELFVADSYAKGNGCTDLAELMKAMEIILSDDKENKIKELYEIQKIRYGGKE